MSQEGQVQVAAPYIVDDAGLGAATVKPQVELDLKELLGSQTGIVGLKSLEAVVELLDVLLAGGHGCQGRRRGDGFHGGDVGDGSKR